MREYNENSEYNMNESFQLDFEKIKFNRIHSSEPITKKTKLVNLEVSHNRNFNTNIGFAHNGGKRKGSFAIYLEPWHSDIFDFIDLRKNHGKEEMRARDLFLALWVPDLFMQRIELDGDWTLFSPDEAPGLSDVYDTPTDKNFTALYESYEQQGLGRQTVKARKLMDSILTAQIETGTPYMLYKDAANYKSNQKNLGTIKSSNLCVAGDTMVDILLEDQEVSMRIDDVIDLIKNHIVNASIKSYNHNIDLIEYKEILAGSLMFLNASVIKITDTITGDFIKCTRNHKIFTENRGYIDAGNLNNNDKIKNKRGVLYHSISIEELNDTVDVYDVTVKDNENFFANGILVHNCAEIIEYSSPTEQAVCNLASIALPKYIVNGIFDHHKLYDAVYQVTKNLNNVIDLNYYPTPETEYSNLKNRPIGIGVQGLADVFCLLNIPFEHSDANQLQTEIFETIYYAGLTASKDMAIQFGPYNSIDGSPIQEGIFQFQLWGKSDNELSGRWNWNELRNEIKTHGTRNSLIISPMPTASCTTIYNEIITENGIKKYTEILEDNGVNWRKIEETHEQQWLMFDKELSVLTMNGYVKTDKMWYNGHKEVFLVEMEDGTTFETTGNHKFLLKTGEWKMVKDLNIDDEIENIDVM